MLIRQIFYLFTTFVIICFAVSGCVTTEKTSVDSLNASNLTASSLMLSQEVNSTSTFLPNNNFTMSPHEVIIPSITMSAQESEVALTTLLNTNGYCIGKCIAGITLDNMTLQDAVNKMAEWGAIEMYENPHTGKVFFYLTQNSIDEQVNVDLSVGTWTKEMITIDTVFFHVSGLPENLLLEKDVWMTSYDAWSGIRIDNILKAYGVPSYVGYFFHTTTGSPSIGRSINYTVVIQYEEMNLIVIIGGLALYDGKSLFICQTEDPHDLAIVINPEQSLEKYQEYASVTWQALTDTNSDFFYQKFTNDPKACVTTTITQIQELQPSFR